MIEQIQEQLKTVTEPALGRDIISADLVRDVTVEGSTAEFTLVFITMTPPYEQQVVEQARQAAESVNGIDKAVVHVAHEIPTSPGTVGREDVPAKNLIAVSSGKGGVGKSTVAANLAVALAEQGAAVGLLDADITGPNIPTLMGVEKAPPPTQNKLTPAKAHGVQLMSMGFLVDRDKPLIWRGPMVHHAIRQLFADVAWDELDYMVVDLPPGTGDAQLTLAQLVPLTGSVIVTQPQEVAVSDARRGLEMFRTVEVEILGVIENMAGDFFGEGGGKALAEERGVPYLGQIPLDPQVRVGGDDGVPVAKSAPTSPAGEAFHRIAQDLATQVSVLVLSEDSGAIPLKTIG